jgi:hypothetical protein
MDKINHSKQVTAGMIQQLKTAITLALSLLTRKTKLAN